MSINGYFCIYLVIKLMFQKRLKEVQNIITAQKVAGLNPAEVTRGDLFLK